MPVAMPHARVPLAPLCTLGVGGTARWLVRAGRVEEIEAADAWSRARGTPLLVLGGGSNLVVADQGWEGLVLHVCMTGMGCIGDRVRAGAGERWDVVVDAAVSRGLAGLECLSGIPGSAGGTPVQNVGAYGQEVAEVIEKVVVFDRSSAALREMSAVECGFGYRTSRFKTVDAGRFVICEVVFRLRAGGAPTVAYPDLERALEGEGIRAPGHADVRRGVLAVRRRKGMVLDPADPDTRSVGSFFTNPVVSAATYEGIGLGLGRPAPGYVVPGGIKVPAAWLIEHAGFQKGDVEGGAGISTKHPLAIINRGGATARDVVRLAARIKRGVAERFGVVLQPEPVFVGFGSDAEVEYLTGRVPPAGPPA